MASGGHDLDIEEDLAGPDALPKKKRFTGAFKKMKRFFTSRMRSKSRDEDGEGSVGLKCKSTPDVLNAPTDDDTEDEGGFVTNKAMSMSADSVFTPDPRPGSSIDGLKETTRSMEVLPQGFTHELFRKIKRRGRADTDDEGLPTSPVSPTSPGSEIGGKLKKSKSGSKDSNLSMASSDNDPDEEIFGPKWSQGVAAQQKNKDKADKKADVDLDIITSSTSLDLSMSKDRIAVNRKKRRPMSRVRQQASPTSTRSPTPLTQVEETNENEDEIQVTIEPPPAQVTPEPVEKTPLLMDEEDEEPTKSIIRPPRTPSPVIQPHSPTVIVMPKTTEEPKQTIAVEKPKEIEVKKEEPTKSNSLPRSLSGSRPSSRESLKKTNSILSSDGEKSDTSLDEIKVKEEVVIAKKEEKEEQKREELTNPVERSNSRISPVPAARISPKPIEKTDSTKRESTPIGIKRASVKRDEPAQPEVLTIERVDSKKEEKVKPPVSPKIKTKHDLPVSPMKEEAQRMEVKTPETPKEVTVEPSKPKEEAKETKESSSFPVVLRRTGKLNEIHEKGTLRKPSLETAAKRQTIAGDAPFSVFADLKEIPSSTQSKDDMASGGEVDGSEFAQMFNKLRKQASVKKSIDEVEKRRTAGTGGSVSALTVRTTSIKVKETESKPEVPVGSPPREKKTEVIVSSPTAEKKPEVVVAASPPKERKPEVTVASPVKEDKPVIGSPPKDVPKKIEPVTAPEPQKKTEIVIAKSEPAERPIVRKLTEKRPPIEKKPEVLSPKPVFANVSLKSPTRPEDKKPLSPIGSLKSPSTNDEQKTVTAKPQVKIEEKKTIVITKETEKEPAPAVKSPTTDKPSVQLNKKTGDEPTSPPANTGTGGSEPSWFALARRKTSNWGDKETEDKEKKDNNNMAVKKEQQETMKTEKPEPTTLIIEKPETTKQEPKEETTGKPVMRTGSKCGSSADRSSKVYDLIKNFQNNQVT